MQLLSATRQPQSRVKPGGLLVLQATVRNTGTSEAAGVVVVTLDGMPDRQSARRVVLAPGETEQAEIYCVLPNSIAGKSTFDITTTLYVDSGSGEVIQDRGGQPAEYTLRLGISDASSVAVFIMDPGPVPQPIWYWPPAPPHTSYEFAVGTRIDAGLSRQTSSFENRPLPLNAADWATADVVVIADEHAFDDAAFTEALKRYITGGGNVWLIMDRMPTEVIRPLLGASQLCETIDEVTLNEFTVEQLGAASPLAKVDLRVTSKTPYKFKRVVQKGGVVTHAIDGWPAAIWMDNGYGKLLLTTLDCAAWTKPRENGSGDARYNSPYTSKVWANLLAISINAPGPALPLSENVEYPLQQIGNPVLPKLWVTLALAGFCLLLALLGLWRALGGEPTLVGFFAPTLAVAVSASLLFASTLVRREIPESIAKFQLVQVSEDGQSAVAEEQAAVYLENTAEMSLESDLDGRVVVDEQVSSGIQRFEIVDFQDWNLTNKAWPAGTWRYRTNFAFNTDGLVVHANLTKDGVELDVPELPSPLEDPVFSFNVGDPLLCQAKGETLLVNGSLSGGDGRWISGTLIDNEQQRRLDVYQAFFRTGEQRRDLKRVLYGWTDLWPQGPTWTRELDQRGSALVALPIRLTRPRTNEPIFIPHGMVGLRRNPNQIGTSFAYDEVSGRWAGELTMAVSARLQLILPPEVLPFEASAIEFELDIKAPQRDLRLLCELPTGPIELVRQASPSIPIKFTVDDPQILQSVRDGVLDIALEVSQRTDAVNQSGSSNVVAWQVDDLNASFRGRVGSTAQEGPQSSGN